MCGVTLSGPSFSAPNLAVYEEMFVGQTHQLIAFPLPRGLMIHRPRIGRCHNEHPDMSLADCSVCCKC